MRKVFIACAFSSAWAEEFLNLANQILKAAEEMLKSPEAVGLIPPLREAVVAFDTVMRQEKENRHTAVVRQADEAADGLWRGLWGMTRVMTVHPNAVRRAVATSIYGILQKYGNATELFKKDQYGYLYNLIRDLEALGSERLALAYVDEWFVALKKRIVVYKDIENAQNMESGTRRVAGIVLNRRVAAEVALRNFLQRIEAWVELNGKTNYSAFINYANAQLDHLQQTIKSRQTLLDDQEG